MKPTRIFALSVAMFSALPVASKLAHAVEYKSVGANPALMYDAPSERGRKVFIAPRGMPVEVVLTYGEWSKVRDVAGDLSWIESKLLLAKRNVVVTAANAKIRSAADDNAAVIFTADRGVLLELATPTTSGWISIKHRDGLAGFIKVTEVWGE